PPPSWCRRSAGCRQVRHRRQASTTPKTRWRAPVAGRAEASVAAAPGRAVAFQKAPSLRGARARRSNRPQARAPREIAAAPFRRLATTMMVERRYFDFADFFFRLGLSV